MEDDDPNQQQSQIVSRTQCSNCGTIKTPLWRRTPHGEIVCNACGLFLKARNIPRPVIVMSKQQEQEQYNDTNEMSNTQKQSITNITMTKEKKRGGGTCPGDGHCNGTGGSISCDGCPAYNNNQYQNKPFQCTNCSTRNSPLWRRDPENNIICNACGLYYKLHNFHRPITMKRTMIKRRKRSTPFTTDPNMTTTSDNNVSKQQPPSNANNIDLENKIDELDTIINRLQRLRNELFQQQQQQCNNKSLTETTMVGINDMTLDSLRDIITKAEVTLLT
ncbi:hypothetical protein INT45_006362 [Circinella minor]|uniref:GATA-type domain-containing protein n=1 Tax=Circinella minor TaxID=1195481 RepID=A0A8H7VNA7_9FUNG|nr:hypothetical protein INT45_006362 [Circinella minor]